MDKPFGLEIELHYKFMQRVVSAPHLEHVNWHNSISVAENAACFKRLAAKIGTIDSNGRLSLRKR